MKFWSKFFQVSITLIIACVCSLSNAADVFIGQVNSIDYQKRTLIVDDVLMTYKPIVIVRNYGSSTDQRLSIQAAVKVNSWVMIEREIDHSKDLDQANQIVVFGSHSEAKTILQSLQND